MDGTLNENFAHFTVRFTPEEIANLTLTQIQEAAIVKAKNFQN